MYLQDVWLTGGLHPQNIVWIHTSFYIGSKLDFMYLWEFWLIGCLYPQNTIWIRTSLYIGSKLYFIHFWDFWRQLLRTDKDLKWQHREWLYTVPWKLFAVWRIRIQANSKLPLPEILNNKDWFQFFPETGKYNCRICSKYKPVTKYRENFYSELAEPAGILKNLIGQNRRTIIEHRNQKIDKTSKI